MRIIASAGSPNGWLEAMGYKGPLPSAIFDGEMLSGWYLSGVTFPDIKIPVDSDEIFVALQIDDKNFSYGYWNSGLLGSMTDIVNNSTVSEDKINQRMFRILNSDGQQIASFGMFTAGNYVYVDQAMGIHSYETASPKSPKNSAGGMTDNGVVPLRSPGGRGVFLHYKYDRTDPTKSFFRYYWGTKLIAELTGSQLTSAANGAPAYFTVFSVRPNIANSRGINIRSMVISDSMDFTLKVVNVRPVTLNNAAQWTGTVADLQEWLQAKTYLATAIETNASFDVNMAVNNAEISAMSATTPGSAQVLSLKTFLGARYVQSGGVSATFRVELFKNGVAYGSPVDVSIPANEDNTTFLTRKIMPIIPAELLLVKDIVNLSIKLTLVG